ncbi:MAG: replication-associated recombination protein A [Elusimicrobia bacterium]|nr:replication-associated recombination protein A [Elusimicrobiota bacterium]
MAYLVRTQITRMKNTDYTDLFRKENISKKEPLASKMSPKTLNEFIGQKHILAEGKLLRRAVDSDNLSSVIFHGPSGCGKSALAKIIADKTEASFQEINAVTSGVDELRKIVAVAENRAKKTILLVDEIHHFNKSQQDCLLPSVENGTIIMIGITTENPYFYINSALLSRSMVFEFKKLTDNDLEKILKRVAVKLKINFDEAAENHLIKYSEGDARRLLNAVEIGYSTTDKNRNGFIDFTLSIAEESIQKKTVIYDKKGDGHYDTISAFIKSMRAGNTDDALYWLAKMLSAGEDPRFVIRRLVIFASEDVGNADPSALILASSALKVVEFIGMPEAKIILSQLTIYLSRAKKLREAIDKIEESTKKIEKEKIIDVPQSLKNK